jgi:glycosyltransferase involved in cell wall biosynthesis
MTTERPLVTFALFAYNQEQYVREALDAAFAQTYSPLEIVLSDDHSSDRTFEIMAEMAEGYCGPHAVRVRRNGANLGIVGHVNAVMAEAAGELIVLAAGDDVSAPERTERLVALWEREGRRPDGVCSGYVAFSDNGAEAERPAEDCSLEGVCRSGAAPLRGATAAWARRLWQAWGPLPADGFCEDQPLSFRALLGGGIASTPELLVRYRATANPQLAGGAMWPARALWAWQRNLRFYDDYTRDLQVLRRDPARAGEAAALIDTLARRRALLARDCGLVGGGRAGILRFCLLLLAGRTWLETSARSRLFITLTLLRRHVLGGSPTPRFDPSDHHALRA